MADATISAGPAVPLEIKTLTGSFHATFAASEATVSVLIVWPFKVVIVPEGTKSCAVEIPSATSPVEQSRKSRINFFAPCFSNWVSFSRTCLAVPASNPCTRRYAMSSCILSSRIRGGGGLGQGQINFLGFGLGPANHRYLHARSRFSGEQRLGLADGHLVAGKPGNRF